MDFIKRSYRECSCRFCKETFCCKDCRLKHEKETHKIEPNCDICVYGKVFISTLQRTDIIQHVESQHLPLNCVSCEEIFISMEEILKHEVKCAKRVKMNNAQDTPTRQNEDKKFLTPNLLANGFVTSTPMNLIMENVNKLTSPTSNNNVLNITKNFTPVIIVTDELHVNENALKTTPNLPEDCLANNKRRVTFSDSPSQEFSRTSNSIVLKSSLKKCTLRRLNSQQAVMEMSNVIAIAERKTTEINRENAVDEFEVVTTTTTTTKKRRSYTKDDTIYASANEEEFSTKEDEQSGVIHDIYRDITNSESETNFTEKTLNSQEIALSSKKIGIWSSMTTFFKTAMDTFTLGVSVSESSASGSSFKRQLVQSECDRLEDRRFHKLKRMKITDIECRPSIKSKYIQSIFKVDKSTQTDDYLFWGS